MAAAPVVVSSPQEKRTQKKQLTTLHDNQPWLSVEQRVSVIADQTLTTYDDTEKSEASQMARRRLMFMGVTAKNNGELSAAPLLRELDAARTKPPPYMSLMLSVLNSGFRFDELTSKNVLHFKDTLRLSVISSAIADPARQSLMDGGKNVVIKVYSILDAASSSKSPGMDGDYVDEIINSIMVGSALNELVDGHETCITPHFAYLFDWFVGPRIIPKDPFAIHGVVSYDHTKLTQYVIEESGGKTPFYILANKMPLDGLFSVIYQITYSLEAAWLTLGFVHNDLHGANVMIKEVSSKKSGYANLHWSYHRPNVRGFVHFKLNQHQNKFVEIIDMGRARAWVSTKKEEGQHDHQCLVGPIDGKDPAYEHNGARRKLVDRSRDVRMLGLTLLQYVNFAALSTTTPNKKLFKRFVDLVGYMIHTRFCYKQLLRSFAQEKKHTVPKPIVEEIEQLYKRYYSIVSVTTDACGSPMLRSATFALNEMLMRHRALYKHFGDILHYYIVCDDSEIFVSHIGGAGLNYFPTPTDVLDLRLWSIYRIDGDAPVPPDTIPVGNLTPESVIMDPMGDLPKGEKLRAIPEEHRRFLPFVSSTVRRLERSTTNENEPEVMSCRFCAMSASFVHAESGHPVCGVLCGQILMQRASLHARLAQD